MFLQGLIHGSANGQHKGCSRQGLQRMYAEPYAPAHTLRYLDRDLRAVLSNRELISAWLGEEVIHLLLKYL